MENKRISESAKASLISSPSMVGSMTIKGVFDCECYDAQGNLKWKDKAYNHVATVGTNLMLDTLMAGSAYTVTGPYMGLISGNSSYSTTAVGDTMASHAGWDEAGSAYVPTYSGTRKTCVWNSASGGAISLSTALSFTFTGAGDVEGCFIVLGSGASSTIDNTGGTLFSAGAFTGGQKTVASTDVLNISYTVTITDT
jgi:hypothetical protein